LSIEEENQFHVDKGFSSSIIKDNGTEKLSQRMSIKPFANECSIFPAKSAML
jgi:hypothetical protein